MIILRCLAYYFPFFNIVNSSRPFSLRILYCIAVYRKYQDVFLNSLVQVTWHRMVFHYVKYNKNAVARPLEFTFKLF